MLNSDVQRHVLLLGGGCVLTNWPTIVTKNKGHRNTVANSFAAWLTLDQLSCKILNIDGVQAPPRSHHRHIPDAKLMELISSIKFHVKMSKAVNLRV